MADSNDHHPELKDKPASILEPTQQIISPDRRSRSESRHSTQSPSDKNSPTKDGPTHSPTRKDRDERIKILQEKRKEEQQKKLDELRQTQLQAQKVREKQEEERRRKIEELKARDEHRRAAVEERRRKLQELEKERREAFWKKAYERDAKIESVKAQQRHSVYAFGSSTSRFMGWESAHTSRRAASQNNLNRKPFEKPSEKRSSSACSYDRKTSGKLKTDGSPFNSSPNNTLKRLSPNVVNPHRKKTDLVPTIPSSSRNSNLTSTFGMNSRSFSGYHYYCTHTPTSPSRSFSNQSDRSASSQASASSSVRSVRKPRPVSIAGTLPDHSSISNTTAVNDAKRQSRCSERAMSKPPRAKSAGTDKSNMGSKAPSPRTSTPIRGPLKAIAGSPVKTAKEPDKSPIKEPVKTPAKEPLKTPTKELAKTPSKEPEEKISAKAAATTPVKSLSPVSTPGTVSPHTPSITPATTPAFEEIPMDSSFTSKRLTSEEEAKAALAERRRLAREQAEKEAELERQRQEELLRQEEEQLRLEAEEAARFEAEQLRLAEEFQKMEEEKLFRAIEENERRLKKERERLEEEQRQKEEAEKRAQEEADRMERERLERAHREEIERLERKRRVEGIMLRIRKPDTPGPKNDLSGENIITPSDEEIKADSSDKESPKWEKSETPVKELISTQEEISIEEVVVTQENKRESEAFEQDLPTLTHENNALIEESLVITESEIENISETMKEPVTTPSQENKISEEPLFITNEKELDIVAIPTEAITSPIQENNLSRNELLTNVNEIDVNDASLQDKNLLIEELVPEIIEEKKLKQERIMPLLEEKKDVSIKEINNSLNNSHLLFEEDEELVASQDNSTIIKTTITETVGNVTIFTTEKVIQDNGTSSPISHQVDNPWNSASTVVSTKTFLSNGVDGDILNFTRDSPIFHPEMSTVEQNISYENKILHSNSLSEDLAEFDMLPKSPETQQQHESHQADFEELIDLSSFSNKNESKHGVYMDHLMNNEDDVNSNTVTTNGPTGTPLIAFDDNITKKESVTTDLL